MQRFFGKVLFTLLFLLLTASTAGVALLAIGAIGNTPVVVERLIIEAGEAMPAAQDFLHYKQLKTFAEREGETYFLTDMALFSATSPLLGEFKIEISHMGSRYTSILEVRDTIPPTGTFVDRISIVGEELPPEEFVRDIRDATRVIVGFDQEVDFYQPGEQILWIYLRDEGNNETRLTGFLHVFEGLRTLKKMVGEPLCHISVADFIFCEDGREGAVIITNLYNLNINVPGLIPVEIWIRGRAEVFFIDLTPSPYGPPSTELFDG